MTPDQLYAHCTAEIEACNRRLIELDEQSEKEQSTEMLARLTVAWHRTDARRNAYADMCSMLREEQNRD